MSCCESSARASGDLFWGLGVSMLESESLEIPSSSDSSLLVPLGSGNDSLSEEVSLTYS